jgi:hypothetical protein
MEHLSERTFEVIATGSPAVSLLLFVALCWIVKLWKEDRKIYREAYEVWRKESDARSETNNKMAGALQLAATSLEALRSSGADHGARLALIEGMLSRRPGSRS